MILLTLVESSAKSSAMSLIEVEYERVACEFVLGVKRLQEKIAIVDFERAAIKFFTIGCQEWNSRAKSFCERMKLESDRSSSVEYP